MLDPDTSKDCGKDLEDFWDLVPNANKYDYASEVIDETSCKLVKNVEFAIETTLLGFAKFLIKIKEELIKKYPNYEKENGTAKETYAFNILCKWVSEQVLEIKTLVILWNCIFQSAELFAGLLIQVVSQTRQV